MSFLTETDDASVTSDMLVYVPITIMMKQADLAKTFLARVQRRDLNGSEPLPGVPSMTVLDYWKWAHADILENVQRGVFAEFLVGAALGVTCEPRIGWAGYDLRYGEYKIEVKSSAYLQAWAQPTLSKLSFGIGPKVQFDPEGEMEKDPRHVADCFVFCVYGDKDPGTADVLDAERWCFYVVPISRLIEYCKTAKSAGENRLKQITTAVQYTELRERIDATRDGQLFPGSDGSAVASAAEPQRNVTMKTFAVWERGTRRHPVIVRAGNATEAYLLARADPTLAALGTTIAGEALSSSRIAELLADGAVDLR
jgi:hypothetical protein